MQARQISTQTAKYQSLTGRFNSARQAARLAHIPEYLTGQWIYTPALSQKQRGSERPSMANQQAHLRVVSHARRTKRPHSVF